MTLLVLLDVLAVLCVAALVATGRGDSLEEVEPDRSPLGELPAGEIGPEQLRSLRFSIASNGGLVMRWNWSSTVSEVQTATIEYVAPQ